MIHRQIGHGQTAAGGHFHQLDQIDLLTEIIADDDGVIFAVDGDVGARGERRVRGDGSPHRAQPLSLHPRALRRGDGPGSRVPGDPRRARSLVAVPRRRRSHDDAVHDALSRRARAPGPCVHHASARRPHGRLALPRPASRGVAPA